LELGLDVASESVRGVPVALILSFFWIAASVFLYRLLNPKIGELLMKREKEVLRIVTSKIE
jgi:hypothetical protein